VIDETPTPPVGILGQQRAAAREHSGRRVSVVPEVRQPPPGPAGSASPPYRVVIADDPSTWSDGSEPAELLGLSPSAQVSAFERLLDGDTRLVLVCGHRQAARVHRVTAVARSVLDARIALVPLPMGPLGQYAMARIAERALAAADRPRTLIVSLLRDLSTRLVDIGLVASVKALDNPAVKLRHHLAGYVPGPHLFAVQLTPTPFVTSVRRAQLGAAATEAIKGADFGAAGMHLLIAGPRPLPDVLAEQLGASEAAIPVIGEFDLTGYWRQPDATEVVMVPADPAAWVAGEVAAQVGLPCGWCDELLAGTALSCVFCGHTPR
jgi:hypothetical protein